MVDPAALPLRPCCLGILGVIDFFLARPLRRRSGAAGLVSEKERRTGPGAIGAEKRACSAVLNHASKTTRAERKRCGSDGSRSHAEHQPGTPCDDAERAGPADSAGGDKLFRCN